MPYGLFVPEVPSEKAKPDARHASLPLIWGRDAVGTLRSAISALHQGGALPGVTDIGTLPELLEQTAVQKI